MKQDILAMDRGELAAACEALGLPKYRAGQIFRWLHVRRVFDFTEMTDISKQFQTQLAGRFCINPPKIAQKLASSLDDTVKYLCTLHDGSCVETVRMVYRHGVTACISTQVGCRMGCAFCASAPLGLVRSLTPSEMLGQIYALDADFPDAPVTGVVLMGIGEPLDNYENVMQFLRLISAPEGRNLSLRHVTLSTCGLVPKIRALASAHLPLTLSVSLHAAEDEKRSALMPVNRAYPLHELLAACSDYFRETGRRVTFEYAVIAGKNDTEQDAAALGRALRPLFPQQRPHVNLIPVNPVQGTGFHAGHAAEFRNKLEKQGINATVRRTLGADIEAACGQLRRNSLQKQGGEQH